MIFTTTQVVIGCIWLFAAALFDSFSKHNEVPDWLNYSFVLTGFAYGVFQSIFQASFFPILYALIGGATAFLVGYGLYLSKSWGGGDAKALAGVGSLIGAGISTYEGLIILAVYIITIMVWGAVIGLAWMVTIAVKKRNIIARSLKKEFRTKRVARIRAVVSTVTLILLVISFLSQAPAKTLFLVGAVMVFFGFYIFLITKTIEKYCLEKKVSADGIVAGDWTSREVRLLKRTIKAKNILTEKDIKDIKAENAILWIRVGMPFLASFFLAFAIIAILGNWIVLLL